MRALTINIPEKVGVEEQKIKMLIATSLYKNDVLNSEQAAELVGISRRIFLEQAGKYGVSVLNEQKEDLEEWSELTL